VLFRSSRWRDLYERLETIFLIVGGVLVANGRERVPPQGTMF